jgi:eukaryotic-like serine/threonine-protein kinase
LVYVVTESIEKNQLWLRPLASVTAQPIPGTNGARLPFWSPDGQNIAFAAGSRIMRIAISGGSPEIVCDLTGEFRGGEWLADGTILFATGISGLKRVSAQGGQVTQVTQLNMSDRSTGHILPVILPDQKHFLFLKDYGDPTKRAIFVGSLDSNQETLLTKSLFGGRYLDPGYLLYIQGTSLVAQKFDIDPPRLSGETVRIVDPQIPMNVLRGAAPYTCSTNGTIAYRVAGTFEKTQLAWFDRGGKSLSTVGPVGSYVGVNLSPDGTRAAISSLTEIRRSVGRAEIPVNIWVVDLARGVQSRVTFDQGVSDENPIWSPDGRWLVFASHRNAGQAQVFRKAASGEGQDQPILLGDHNEHPIDWSADGKFLLMHSAGDTTDLDLMFLPLPGTSKPQSFVVTLAKEAQGQFSPDGRWIAYTSGESGRVEVYVKRFPSGEGKWQISSGGSEPRWRSDGKELFYIASDGKMMAVTIKAGDNLEVSPPAALFSTNLPYQDLDFYGGAHRYDVTADGSRFLLNTVVIPGTPPSMVVITNWRPPR